MPKKKKQPGESATCRFRIDKRFTELLWQKAQTYQHFLNMFLILRHTLYRLKTEKDFIPPCKLESTVDLELLHKSFSSPAVFRDTIMGRKGKSYADKIKLLNSTLSEWPLFKDLKQAADELQPKNVYKLIGKVEGAFKSFFTKLKQGDAKVKKPKPKKLSNCYQLTIPIDKDCLSLKRKNLVGININSKMIYFPLKHEKILKITGSLEAVQSAEIVCRKDHATLHLIYDKQPKLKAVSSETKEAGLDLGINNIATLFVMDDSTPSRLVSGGSLIRFNANNNRRLAKLKSKRDQYKNQLKQEDCQASQLREIQSLIARAYKNRYEYFYNCFHKLSRRLLEDLEEAKVTDLYCSTNLGEAKQDPNATMGKKQNQKFHEIPLVRLVHLLKEKAAEYGIRVIDIDESYSSKASCLSGDVAKAQEMSREGKLSMANRADVFKGRRAKRSLYFDHTFKKGVHADINAAVNHVLIGVNKDKANVNLRDLLWKLTNPIKLNAYHCYLDRRVA